MPRSASCPGCVPAGHDIVGLIATETATGHRGPPGPPRRRRTTRTLPADLVMDATGRGSRTPRWLAELGYPTPNEDRLEIGLGYASRTYRLRPGALGADHGVVTGATPSVPRGGVLAAIEGDRYILTLSGILGDHPPIDPAEFEAFAATLVFPDITQALQGAQPLDDPVAIRFPASVRRRYERLRRFPQQLLVTGDAVCSFNPVYGQGMTVAALEALALRQLLAGGVSQPRRYFRDIARLVDVAWDMAVGGDLAFPQVPGPRPAKVRLVNAYLARLQAAAASDASLATAFIRVVGSGRATPVADHPRPGRSGPARRAPALGRWDSCQPGSLSQPRLSMRGDGVQVLVVGAGIAALAAARHAAGLGCRGRGRSTATRGHPGRHRALPAGHRAWKETVLSHRPYHPSTVSAEWVVLSDAHARVHFLTSSPTELLKDKQMHLFLDVHSLDDPVTINDVAEAHDADLRTQVPHGVNCCATGWTRVGKISLSRGRALCGPHGGRAPRGARTGRPGDLPRSPKGKLT